MQEIRFMDICEQEVVSISKIVCFMEGFSGKLDRAIFQLFFQLSFNCFFHIVFLKNGNTPPFAR